MEFAYDGGPFDISRFGYYERRYQENVHRIGEFQRRERAGRGFGSHVARSIIFTGSQELFSETSLFSLFCKIKNGERYTVLVYRKVLQPQLQRTNFTIINKQAGTIHKASRQEAVQMQ